MKGFPPTPSPDDAADHVFEEGHLWILELIDGGPLRFQLRESGVVRFGDRDRVFDADSIPAPYRHAVRHVRETLDREALRAAVDDASDVVFFGVSTHRTGVAYDWERVPPFLGCDVWSAEKGTYRSPDAATAIFDRLGLDPVNAFDREVRARDFDPDAYAVPRSNWYDGPAAGAVVRNKRGGRAVLSNPELGDADAPDSPVDAEPADLAERYVTERRLERVAADLADRGRAVTVDALFDRVLEDVAREAPPALYGEDATVDRGAFRSAAAERTRAFLDDRATE